MTYWPESLEDSWAASVSGRNATASNRPMTSGVLNMGISYQFGGASRAHFSGFRECEQALLGRCNPCRTAFSIRTIGSRWRWAVQNCSFSMIHLYNVFEQPHRTETSPLIASATRIYTPADGKPHNGRVPGAHMRSHDECEKRLEVESRPGAARKRNSSGSYFFRGMPAVGNVRFPDHPPAMRRRGMASVFSTSPLHGRSQDPG